MENSLDETLRTGSMSNRRTRRASEPAQPSPRRSKKSPTRKSVSSTAGKEQLQSPTRSGKTSPNSTSESKPAKTPRRRSSAKRPSGNDTESARDPCRPLIKTSTKTPKSLKEMEPDHESRDRLMKSSTDTEISSLLDTEQTQRSYRRLLRSSTAPCELDTEPAAISLKRSLRSTAETSTSSVKDREPSKQSHRRSLRHSKETPSVTDTEPALEQESCRRSLRSSTGTSTSSSIGAFDSPRDRPNDSVHSSQSDLCEHTCNECHENRTDSMCMDCQTYMCSVCMQGHLETNKGHRKTEVSVRSGIITIPSTMGESVDVASGTFEKNGTSASEKLKLRSFGTTPTICTCNDNSRSTDVYCSDHCEFCCKQCETWNHQACDTRSVESLLIETDMSKLKANTSKMLKKRLGELVPFMRKNDRTKIDALKSSLTKKSERHTEDLIKVIKDSHNAFVEELDKAVKINLEMVEVCERNIRDIQQHIQCIEQPKRLSEQEDRLTQLKVLKTIECKHLKDYKVVAKRLKDSTSVRRLEYHPNEELLNHLKQSIIGHLCTGNKVTSNCFPSTKLGSKCSESKSANSKCVNEDSNGTIPTSEDSLSGSKSGASQVLMDNTNRSSLTDNEKLRVSAKYTEHLNISGAIVNTMHNLEDSAQLLSERTGGVDIVPDILSDTHANTNHTNDILTTSKSNTDTVTQRRKVQVSEKDCEFISCWSEGDCGTKTCITDIKRVNSNTLIIADNDNKKLKLFKSHGPTAGYIISEELDGEPWQIAEYDTNKFIVTVLKDAQHVCLVVEVMGLYVNVTKEFPMHKDCTGIAVNGDNIILCGYDGDNAYIIETDITGKIQNEINFYGRTGLARPNYLCVSDDASLLYVSDVDRGVFGLSMDDLNVVVFRFKEGIVCPMGMTIDDNGDLIVCAAQSHALYRLSQDGQLKTVYSVGQKQFQFQSVCLFEGSYVLASSDDIGYKLIKIPISG